MITQSNPVRRQKMFLSLTKPNSDHKVLFNERNSLEPSLHLLPTRYEYVPIVPEI